MRRLDGRVAVVTGAGGGIGRATSEALAARGCHLALVDVAPGPLRATAEIVARPGRSVSTHVVDVADDAGVRALATEVHERHGGCEILVNNAGVTSAGRFEAESLADLEWIIGINVWGVLHGCRAFLPLLRQADEAHIVNLASMASLVGLPHNAAYSLTKGAVRAFTEALRAELVCTAIGVTSVLPGAINTGITTSARGAAGARLAGLGRSRLAPVLLRPPEAVAGKIVRAIERRRARVVVGPDAHLLDVVSRVLPGRSGLIGRAAHLVTR